MSHKNHAEVAALLPDQKELIREFERLNIEFTRHGTDVEMANLVVEPTIVEKIKEAQQHDEALQLVKHEMPNGKYTDFKIGVDGEYLSKPHRPFIIINGYFIRPTWRLIYFLGSIIYTPM